MRNLAVVTFLLLAIGCFAQDESVSIKRVSTIGRAVIPVVCGYLDDQKEFQISFVAGSGFFIDKAGRFLTANHVLENWDEAIKRRHACTPAIYIPNKGWGKFQKRIAMQYFWFSECVRDSRVDLAVCTPIESPFSTTRLPKDVVNFVTFNTEELAVGTPIAFTGFPLEYTFPITSFGFVAGLTGTPEADGSYDYIVDKSAWPGASGSLVYLNDGRVVGLIRQRGDAQASGIAIARSSSVIVNFLSKNPIAKK